MPYLELNRNSLPLITNIAARKSNNYANEAGFAAVTDSAMFWPCSGIAAMRLRTRLGDLSFLVPCNGAAGWNLPCPIDQCHLEISALQDMFAVLIYQLRRRLSIGSSPVCSGRLNSAMALLASHGSSLHWWNKSDRLQAMKFFFAAIFLGIVTWPWMIW